MSGASSLLAMPRRAGLARDGGSPRAEDRWSGLWVENQREKPLHLPLDTSIKRVLDQSWRGLVCAPVSHHTNAHLLGLMID
jgi:hypothetical protein